MTKPELIEKLRKIQEDTWDKEKNHGEADDLLLAYIGDEDITDAFNDIEKWYA